MMNCDGFRPITRTKVGRLRQHGWQRGNNLSSQIGMRGFLNPILSKVYPEVRGWNLGGTAVYPPQNLGWFLFVQGRISSIHQEKAITKLV